VSCGFARCSCETFCVIFSQGLFSLCLFPHLFPPTQRSLFFVRPFGQDVAAALKTCVSHRIVSVADIETERLWSKGSFEVPSAGMFTTPGTTTTTTRPRTTTTTTTTTRTGTVKPSFNAWAVQDGNDDPELDLDMLGAFPLSTTIIWSTTFSSRTRTPAPVPVDWPAVLACVVGSQWRKDFRTSLMALNLERARMEKTPACLTSECIATTLKIVRAAEEAFRSVVQQRVVIVEKLRSLCAPVCDTAIGVDAKIAQSHMRASIGNTQLSLEIGVPGAVLSGLAVIATSLLLVSVNRLLQFQLSNPFSGLPNQRQSHFWSRNSFWDSCSAAVGIFDSLCVVGAALEWEWSRDNCS
jgi:hypothetical protein